MAWNILTAIDQLVKGKTMVYDYINKLIENVQYVKDNAGTGNGDMSKATYDKNDDGIVDRAAAVDDGVTGNWTTAAEIATSVNNTHLHSNKSALDLVSGINTGDQNLTGYMLKSTYDTGNDGIVDRAAAVDDGVTGNWTTAAEIANAVNHVIRTDNPHSVTKTQLSLNNVDNVQQMPLSYLDTDGTLAANSDSKVASQKATKTYYLSGEMVKSDSTGISTHYTNSTTGANANDGFLVGIDASENAIIKNQENKDAWIPIDGEMD